MRTIASTILAAAGLALAAATPAVAYDQALLDRVEQIARAQWPASPCAGREQVTITDDLQRKDALGEALWDGPCAVRIRPSLLPYTLCVVMAHEFGHLSGYRGNDPDDPLHDVEGTLMSPAGLLYPGADMYVPCMPLNTPSPRVPTRAEIAHAARKFASRAAHTRPTRCRLIEAYPVGLRHEFRTYRCGLTRIRVTLFNDVPRTAVAVR